MAVIWWRKLDQPRHLAFGERHSKPAARVFELQMNHLEGLRALGRRRTVRRERRPDRASISFFWAAWLSMRVSI